MPITMTKNTYSSKDQPNIDHLSEDQAKKINNFHKTFPDYEMTPLVSLEHLSKELQVKNIYVKDESFRFGLNAFKVLGGSYAIGKYIAKQLGEPIEALDYNRMISKEVRDKLGNLTFISATDGNHGRGVAWTVNQLKQNSVIYMPKGSAIERLENIKAEGAHAEITDLNYDDAVRLANTHCEENGWVLVQDTSWDGYEDIPTNIMQGYMTLSYEILQQLEEEKPTHIFLQAGVGSFATSVTGFFASVYKEDAPEVIIVEPDNAACIYKTLKANDGQVHVVDGDMQTIMAGLACGEPVTIGIELLRYYAGHALSCSDDIAATGMRVLGAPMGDDQKIVSGESGAAGFGAAYEILTNQAYSDVKEALGINEESVLLFINTEGDTDKENYRKILWEGMYTKASK